MRKRMLLIPLALLLALSLVATGCPAPAPPTAPEAEAEIAKLEADIAKLESSSEAEITKLKKELAEAKKVVAPEVLKWKMQVHCPPADPDYGPGARFAERVTTMSGGRFNIEFFEAGSVVPAGEEGDGVRVGVLDAADTAMSFNVHLVPAGSLFNQMSGGLSSNQMTHWYRAGGGRELEREAFAPFFVVLTNCVLAPEDWAYTTFPLETAGDIRKLKMRTAGEGGEILARMGAATVWLPAGELYESMQRGVINSFEYASATAFWDMAFQEIADYLYVSPSRAPSDGFALIANTESYKALPLDLKEIVGVAAELELNQLFSELMASDAKAMVKIKEYGTQVLPLPKEIEDAFIAEASAFYDEKAATIGGIYTRVVESQREFKKLCELQGIN